MRQLSKRAKVVSDKPAYREKKKTDHGYVWVYDEKHIEKRWKEKKKKLESLNKNITKVRKQYNKDLSSDDLRTRAIAAIVGIMDDTAMRVGNEDSVKEADTYGATTLKVKHVHIKGNKAIFKFTGKDQVKQDVETSNSKIVKVLKELIKDKKSDDFVFEVEDTKIWDRAVNRYLTQFDISAKDLRGYQANKIMKEVLKKKEWKEALDEVADIVGHKPATLKNQYLDPELVEKYETKKKASISIRAQDLPMAGSPDYEDKGIEDDKAGSSVPSAPPIAVDPNKNTANVSSRSDLQSSPHLNMAWRIIAPFLPSGATLTSAFRDDFAQASLILQIWCSWRWDGGTAEIWKGFFYTHHNDKFSKPFSQAELRRLRFRAESKQISARDVGRINELQKFMSTYSGQNIVGEPPGQLDIAAIGDSEHKEGMAIDIAGVHINDVTKALAFINSRLGNPLPTKEIRSEPSNKNAIHVVFSGSPSAPNSQAFVEALKEYEQQKTQKKRSSDIALSKRAKLTPEDSSWLRRIGPTSSVSSGLMAGKDVAAKNVNPRAKLTPVILDAWKMLQPFLPSSARLTSGFRTPEDQINILRNYWRQYEGGEIPANINYDDVSKILKRNHGLIVGPPHTTNPYAHLKGNAMDVSGADLYEIADIVKQVSSIPGLNVKLSPQIEDANNCVHISVISAKYDQLALNNALRNFGYAADDSDTSQQESDMLKSKIELYDDLKQSAAPNDFLKAFVAEIRSEMPDLSELNPDDDKFMLSLKTACQTNKISKRAEEPQVEDPKNPHGVGTTMGFGIDDEMGDWFEKSPMFINRTDVPEYDIHDVSEAEAKAMISKEPDKFFYRGLHKTYPNLESDAIKGVIETNAKFFFIFKYHEREEDVFKQLIERAAELLSQQDVRAFFYYMLHHKFPELGRGAIIQLIDTNPDSFFDLGLQKDYPDLEESANAARNIKDPNKVELEQPEWIKNDSGQAISLRDKNAIMVQVPRLPDVKKEDNIVKEPQPGIPHKAADILSSLSEETIVTDTFISGSRQISDDPKVVLEWLLIDNSDKATDPEDKYAAKIVMVQYPSPGFTERNTIFDCSEEDAVLLAKEIRDELGNPSFIDEVMGRLVSTIEQQTQKQELRKSLNSDNLKKKISKRAEAPKITLTDKEKKIFELLKETIAENNLGSTIRVAGGWVRDKIMGKQSKDLDITIDNMSGKQFAEHVVRHLQSKGVPAKSVGVIEARPEQSKHLETAVINIFDQPIDFVQLRGEKYDPATRIPKITVGTAIEDAYRRDFTINSLFYNINEDKIEDFTGKGLDDIQNKIIRTPVPSHEVWSQVGIHAEEQAITPKKTFMDDPLRVLRAIRFASRYGFDLDKDLMEAAKDPDVQQAFAKKISRERIEEELRKMLVGPNPRWAMELIKSLNMQSEIFQLPEGFDKWDMDQNNPNHELNIWGHLMEALGNLQIILKDRNIEDTDKFVLNLAAIMHDVGKLDPSIKGTKEVEGQLINTYQGHEESSMRAAEHMLRKLPGITNKEIERVKQLIDASRRVNPAYKDSSEMCDRSDKALRKFVQFIQDDWENAIDLATADASAHKIGWINTFERTYFNTMKERIKGLGPEQIKNIKPLVNGQEIMQMFGRKGGPWMTKLISSLIDWQLGNPTATKEDAKQELQNIYMTLGLDKASCISIRDNKISLAARHKDNQYPKRCAVCGKEYKNEEEFLSLPFKNNIYKGNPLNDPGLQCMEADWDMNTGLDIVYRDCDCGSTMIVKIKCLHKQTKQAISKRATDEEFESEIDKMLENSGSAKALGDQYWIDPTGKIHLAPKGHVQFVLDHPEIFGVVEDHSKAYEHAFRKDWIRVANWGGDSLDFNTPSPLKQNYLHRAQEAISSLPKVKQVVIEGGTTYFVVPYSVFVAANTLKDLQHEYYADDNDANKYEREKDDKKWDDILIDKEGTKLTRKEIRDHYVKNSQKILKEIKDKPVMLYLLPSKNKPILKRNHNDKEIVITNADKDKSGDSNNLIYWADRRLASIHLVMGKTTKLGWIDLDLHGNFSKEKALEYAKKVSPVIKKELGGTTQVWESGGTGYHIEISLQKEMDIDDLRNKLKEILDEFNKDWEGVTTGIVKGNGMRSDISTLHEKGNLRARYSIGETYGHEKKPLKISKRD